MNKGPKFPVNQSGRPCKTVHPGRPRKMSENDISSEAKEGRTDILGVLSHDDDEGAKNSISDMDEAELPLVEGYNKVSRENIAEELVETLLYENEEGIKKASSEMDVEALSLE